MVSIINDVQRIFNLNEEDKTKIEVCVKKYAKKCIADQETFIYRMDNLFKRLWNKSDWQMAEHTLETYAVSIVRSRLISTIEDSCIAHKANKLSTFILNYLVTKESFDQGTGGQIIPREEWFLYKLGEMQLDRIIDRFIVKDERFQEELSESEALQLVKREDNLFKEDIEKINHFIQKSMKSIQLLEKKDALETLNLIAVINNLSQKYQKVCSNKENILLECSLNDLQGLLQSIREMHRSFSNIRRCLVIKLPQVEWE